MNWKKLDLRKATIFDLTTDPEIIKQFWEPNFLCPTKEDYLNQTENSDERGTVLFLLELAAITHDNELREAIEKEFSTELLTFGFE
jgi:hypothetical protein